MTEPQVPANAPKTKLAYRRLRMRNEFVQSALHFVTTPLSATRIDPAQGWTTYVPPAVMLCLALRPLFEGLEQRRKYKHALKTGVASLGAQWMYAQAYLSQKASDAAINTAVFGVVAGLGAVGLSQAATHTAEALAIMVGCVGLSAYFGYKAVGYYMAAREVRRLNPRRRNIQYKPKI